MTAPPIIRPISWPAALPQFLIYGVAASLGFYVLPANRFLGLASGTTICLLYSFGSRMILTRHHRAGISLSQQGQFTEAIEENRRSHAFFERHAWIDRFRSIVLMNPSAMCYREMALTNIASCYIHLGNNEQARTHYEECLRRFPHSALARAALREMDEAASLSLSR